MDFKSEQEFENALIKLLSTDCGWEPEILRYKTEKDLIQNWANILFENNRGIDRLNDAPLTDGEMQQILEQIKTLRTPVKLNGFINGKTITIRRDNPDDKLHFGHEVSLKIYDRQEIAAGQSRYQIAEQPVFKARSALLNDRRGDFILLINGMPVIHVELKKTNVPISHATEQIRIYSHEGVFTGLFSLVQLFVAMTPKETLYYANPGPDADFNPDYYFHWADFNNEPINEWYRIAHDLLSIPTAHMMIGFYTVADDTDNCLKVMRSYQYYAARAISERVAKRKWNEPDQRGGYVWHTTGSGKTLTSFKSAQLIANSANADKVVFLMDRVELGTQSLQDYRGFADDADSVQSTENTNALIAKMKSDNPAEILIVTSIQKMSRVKEDGTRPKDIEIINKKRIVFIIDEAHRDVFGEMLRTIKETFPGAMFFGFTGTPIHLENQKKHNTTTDVFGNELHRYLISDGIRDKNVLGFDPTKVMVYKDKDLREVVALEKAKAKSVADVFGDPDKEAIYYQFMDPKSTPMAGYRLDDGGWVKGIEDFIPRSQYETDEYQKVVVEDICNNWVQLSRGSKFHAIFATSSIPEAISYYRLFKQVDSSIKVAALFDQNIDYNGTGVFKEDAIVEMLEDYNKRYNQKFTMVTYPAYKKDVSLRLAHKRPYVGIEKDKAKEVDLLIVVDQMLTGFDSKWINTLYLDKVLKYEKLIQAFSRTNRLFGPGKPHGIIRYYRKPHTMEKNIEDAVALYSGNKPLALFVDKLEQNLLNMNRVYEDIEDLFNGAGIEDFERLPKDKTEKARFARLFREFNDYLEAAFIQGFSWKQMKYSFRHSKNLKITVDAHCDETHYLILALRYKELFPGGSGGVLADDVPYDIDPYLTEINTDVIDHDYMNSRFRKYLKALQSGEEVDGVLSELHKSFATLSAEDQKYANMLLFDIQSGNREIEEGKTLTEYITEYRIEVSNDRIHKFSVAIGVDEKQLRAFMGRNVTEDNINDFGLFDKLKGTVDLNTAKEYFERVEGQTVKPFRVPAKVDKLLREFVLKGGFDLD